MWYKDREINRDRQTNRRKDRQTDSEKDRRIDAQTVRCVFCRPDVMPIALNVSISNINNLN